MTAMKRVCRMGLAICEMVTRSMAPPERLSLRSVWSLPGPPCPFARPSKRSTPICREGTPAAAHQSYKSARAGHEEDEAQEKGPGFKSQPLSSRSKALVLGVLVGPYLAVDLLDEGLAVLVVPLELAHLLELLGGKALDPPGNFRHGQLVVVRGPERAHNGGP